MPLLLCLQVNAQHVFDIRIRKQYILEDSYQLIGKEEQVQKLRCKLWVKFEKEQGVDNGGLAREWLFLLSKEIFNPCYGLFGYTSM
jgi:hypothetical protein